MTDDDEGGTQPPRSGWAEIHRIWATVLRSLTDRITDQFPLSIVAVLLICAALSFAGKDNWFVLVFGAMGIGPITSLRAMRVKFGQRRQRSKAKEASSKGRRRLAKRHEKAIRAAEPPLDSTRERTNMPPDTGR